ncbi:oligoendopeptidase F [candidate division KSB1 bacterium]|nr:oligoendopeptidase F [candidate division KSB1 bacterium]RQW06850.1 MAG: oligoendopeptidase F [candidate division KSB1 bacterium]
MKKAGLLMMLTGLLMWSHTDVIAQMQRSEVAEKYKWDLTDLYESDAAWEAKKDEIASRFDTVLEFKGNLGTSAKALLECLEFNSDLSREFTQLYVYAAQKSDLDIRESAPQAMKQQVQQLGAEFNAKASFIEPEILVMDVEKINQFLAEEEGLSVYEFYLKDLLRKKEHRLSEDEEKILANAGLITSAPYDTYSILTNADLPYPEVELSDGSTATLTSAGYAKHRASSNRDDRELVFKEFFGALKKFSRTLASSLASNVKTDLFVTRSRGYETCLERALDDDNIPTAVYMSLIENVNNNLNSFHRYLDIKRRMLGVDTLKYIDMYAPTVKGVDLKYTIDEAYEIVMTSLAPLGEDYIGTIKTASENRWIDVYPTIGKRSGAYSSGSAYDVHPYILLNFNNKYDDVSTLAHELGHTMHSYYSNKTQPYPLANYSIFVAEVASTFNEALLIDYMLKKIKDDDVRLSLLMEYLDGLKGTVFRQTQFAEFELRIHEMVEKGEALTDESLTALYADIVRRYYGDDTGVCVVDDLYTYEWAYIPHFYYNFYVYQYSTSFTASTALAEKVLNNETGAVEKYINFISAGGSDYPINLLKNAGVDMTTSEPFDKTMVKMNRVMDEIEKILEKKGM